MKNNEVLHYPLADIGPESPEMTVHLHRTPAGYWQFRLEHNIQIDLADRLFEYLAELAGFDDRVIEAFKKIPRKRHCYPCLWSCSPLFSSGWYFPDRESVMQLIENEYVPCWKYAVGRIMENYSPGDSWLQAVRKTEREVWRRQSE